MRGNSCHIGLRYGETRWSRTNSQFGVQTSQEGTGTAKDDFIVDASRDRIDLC